MPTPAHAGSQRGAAHCQNVNAAGQKCNAVLDREGQHASVCECGGGTLRRHNAIRDRIAKAVAEDLGLATHTEQHYASLDQVDDDGTLRKGIMDIVVAGPSRAHLLDVTIVSPWSADATTEAAKREA